MPSRLQRRYVIALAFGLCLFVLLFAAQVKLSQYRAAAPSPDPVTASKLWLKNQKMELVAASPLLLVLCLALLFSVASPRATRQWPHSQAAVAIASRRGRFEPYRFLRPPPGV